MKEKGKQAKILIGELYAFKPMIFGAGFTTLCLKAFLPLLQLILSAQIIEWLLSGVSVQYYLGRLLIFVSVIGIAQVLNQYFNLYFEENNEQFRFKMMGKMQMKYLELDYPLLVGKEAQERYNNALELSDHYQSLFGRIINEGLDFGSSLLAVIIYISILSQLEAIFIVLVVGFVLLVGLFSMLNIKLDRKLFSLKAANTQKLRYIRKLYGESRLTKDIRLFKMKKWFSQIEKDAIHDYHQILQPKLWLNWTESVVLNIGIISLAGLSYVRSVQLIVQGTIPVSSFVLFAGSVTILAQSIMTFINAWARISISMNETSKYDEFMTQKDVFNHSKGVKVPEKEITIELKNVSYTYPNSDKKIVKNVNLKIDPHEKLALVGENGAGKTTLVNLISGLLQPDSGVILINGIPQEKFNIEEYYTMFAPVFQEKFLLTYSIRDTIIQGLDYDAQKYQKVLQVSGVNKLIEQFEKGDETKIVRPVHVDGITLSGGQLQKLKLAQAIYKDAPVLILDEPTAALDPIAEHQVYSDYLKFSQDKLSIFISHRLSSTRFCDRIVYLKEGSITEVGSHAELMEDRKDYYKLFEAQAYYYREQKEHSDTFKGGVTNE